MKKFFIITTFVLFLINFKIAAQEYTTIEILNLEPEIARNAINQTFKDLKLPPMHIWNNETSTESSFYTYTSLMVKNRFVFKVDVEPNKLTISIINRQYYTNNHWADSPLPMSKKQAAKILNPIKEKILELTKSI
ncbi:hypothetical protein [Lutibacter maritimus]|uniref:Uncharacterized protein n=1 Tax=Lutibacter maritimus TaxID=593133 RepID=A0A1I6S0A0_9FLAO|nr:hypothetical protein [Lutibacter maritimus]SFS70381.1 hypothetical protein SAMN04488006_2701 [Lutibacter maritimus]